MDLLHARRKKVARTPVLCALNSLNACRLPTSTGVSVEYKKIIVTSLSLFCGIFTARPLCSQCRAL